MIRAKIAERSALEWFLEAERWYVVGHQGCPLCHGQHCVFRSDWSGLIEYFCSACDFSTCRDSARGEFFAVVGTPAEARTPPECPEAIGPPAFGAGPDTTTEPQRGGIQ